MKDVKDVAKVTIRIMMNVKTVLYELGVLSSF
jgi:hypothetical protein